MKISTQTLNTLKNFSNINTSILIEAGNVIETCSKQQDVVAQVKVDEVFPTDVAIYDLTHFLGAISIFKDADFEFGEQSVTITSGASSIVFGYCNPALLADTTDIKENLKKLQTVSLSFKLSNDDLQALQKSSSILSLPDFVVQAQGGALKCVVTDVKNASSNNFSIDLDTEIEDEAKYVFKCEKMKLLPGNYIVDILTKGSIAVGRFTHNTGLVYHVIVEDVDY